jgi:hypothetical protein
MIYLAGTDVGRNMNRGYSLAVMPNTLGTIDVIRDRGRNCSPRDRPHARMPTNADAKDHLRSAVAAKLKRGYIRLTWLAAGTRTDHQPEYHL